MKKLLFLFVIVALTSCNIEDTSKPTRTMKTGAPFEQIIEFKYKKHDYIKFGAGNQAGVVHDPDCKLCLSVYD